MHNFFKKIWIVLILSLLFQSRASSQCIARYGYVIDSFYIGSFYDTSLVDISLGPPIRNWYVNDSMTAVKANFTYRFPDTGIYRVCLLIATADSSCIDTICKDISITMPSCSASFNAQHVENYTYSFNNMSSANLDTWHWSFGDGQVSGEQNPEHTYQFPGKYLTCLNAEDKKHMCFHNYCDSIEVLDTTPCISDFIYYDDNYDVYFSNNSTGPVKDVIWHFGDGTTSTEMSPHHTYASTGSYMVKLIVHGPTSVHPYDTITDEIIVTYTYSREPRYKLMGQVYMPDSSLIYSGHVVLIREDSHGYCYNMDTVNISFGDFNFTGIKGGNYYIKAIPSFKMAFFPSTYYVSASSLEKAYRIPIYSNTGSIDIIINSGMSIMNEKKHEHTFNIYPNPADNHVNINLPPKSEHVSMLDLHGKKIIQKMLVEELSNLEINVTDIPPGTYIILIETGENRYYKKLMVQ